MLQDLMTTAQAASRLRCSPRTVTRWVESGRLKAAEKFPGPTGGYLFGAEEVERMAAELADEMERELAELRAVAEQTAST